VQFVDAVKAHQPLAVGLSCLLTITAGEVGKVLDALRRAAYAIGSSHHRRAALDGTVRRATWRPTPSRPTRSPAPTS